jgi:mycothione reductase
MFVHTADLAAGTRGSSRFGVDAHVDKVRWADIRDRIFNRIDPISQAGEVYRREAPNVTVYAEHARFTGMKRLELAGGEEITADRIVIAAGSRAVIPDIPGLAETRMHTTDTIMRIDALPASMVILGGGVIAAEMAHVFSALGTAVTVIARSARLLMVEADIVLVATGRVPNADRLEVAATGVATHPDGRVVVDVQQRTVVPGIWALGDVSSKHQLKHVANHEARVVQHNLLDPEHPENSDHRFVPHAIFTSPQIASVGKTEDDLLMSGTPYISAIEGYDGIAYGWAMEDTTGFAKVLADPASGLLLGAHIIGPQAPSVIQPVIQAMHFGLPAHEMARGQYWIHPAMPEVVENALLKLA